MHAAAVNEDFHMVFTLFLKQQVVEAEGKESFFGDAALFPLSFSPEFQFGDLLAGGSGDHCADGEIFAFLRDEFQRQEELGVTEGKPRGMDVGKGADDGRAPFLVREGVITNERPIDSRHMLSI